MPRENTWPSCCEESCKRIVKPGQLFCGIHWLKLPEDLRAKIMLAWEFGNKALLKRLGNLAYGFLIGIPKQEQVQETILHHPLAAHKRVMKDRFALSSVQDQHQALMNTDSKTVRLDLPMRHRDHIQNAANVIHDLADYLDVIANRKQKNINRIFDARIAVKIAKDEIVQYAADDIALVDELQRDCNTL